MCRLGAMKIASVFTANFIRITLPINPLFLSQLGTENEHDTVQDNITENQVVKDCDDDQLALSWHKVGTQFQKKHVLMFFSRHSDVYILWIA